MAERRMFTKKVTDDDNFMALSSSAQALYLHLSMCADDDGFCNQVSISMFKAHASVQDLQALLEKRYIYQFENGVIVIKHWRMANALRKDRYTPTAFKEELAQLEIKDNGSYTWLPSGCQVVADCLPQDRIGKDRIDKDSIEEEKNKRIDYQLIADMYNDTCVSFPKVQSLSDARKKAIKARLNTYSIDDFKVLFEKAESSEFLKGGNDRNWSANFDWLIKDSNMAKVLDGNYDKKASKGSGRKEPVPNWMKKNSFNNFPQRDYDDDELEKQLLNRNKTTTNNPELAARVEALKVELGQKGTE